MQLPDAVEACFAVVIWSLKEGVGCEWGGNHSSLLVLLNKQFPLILAALAPREHNFKGFLHRAKANLNHLCAQNTHPGYLSSS